MPKAPANTHTFEIQLTPDESAIEDFDAWVDAQRKRLEAANLTITDVTGACFSGVYDPEDVDLSVLD